MLAYEVSKDNDMVVMTSIGQVTFEDFQSVMPKFITDIRSLSIRKMLLDDRMHEGSASQRAEAISSHALRDARALFDKIAYVSPRSKDALELLEFFRNSSTDIRHFLPAQYDSALDWLKGAQAMKD